MFESKLAVVLNPQMLNKFEENKTTVEMVEKAIEKGYKITLRTPLFLFKYDAIIELALSSFRIHYSDERLSVMLSNDNKRKDVIEALTNYVKRITRGEKISFPKEYYGDIEPSENNVVLIQKQLGIEYLKSYPDYVYNEYFDVSNYNKDELFSFFREYNIELEKIKITNTEDFIKLISYIPTVIKLDKFVGFLDDNNVRRKIVECIRNDKLTIDDIPEQLLNVQIIMQSLVSQDLNLINKFNRSKLGIDMNSVATKFVDELPESLKYIEELSKVEYSSSYFEKYSDQIIAAIRESGFEIVDCDWSFVYSNIDLMLEQFEKNPNIINTCKNFLQYAYFDEEQRKRFVDLLARDEVEIKVFLDCYRNYTEIMELVIKKNPYLLYTVGNNKFPYTHIYNVGDVLVTPSGMYGENFEADIVDAVRMNPDNYFAVNNAYDLMKKIGDEVYVAALESRRDPLRGNSRVGISKNTDLVKIDELRLNGGLDREVTLSGYGEDYLYSLFIVANYPEYVKGDSTFSHRVSKFRNTIYKGLYEDFSNYYSVVRNSDISEEDLIVIKDLFYEYKDKGNDISSDVYDNPYVYIEELLNNGKFNEKKQLNDAQLEYFNKRFKELGLKCDSKFISYIRDFDVFVDYILNADRVNVSYEWLSDEQKNILYDKFKEQVLLGRRNLSYYPRQFVIDEFDFVKEHFDPIAIASLFKHAVVNDKTRVVFDYLKESVSFVNQYDYFQEFNDQEFEELVERNVTYFKLMFKHVDEKSPLYSRKDIFDKVYAKFTKLNEMDPVDVDYLLEHNVTDLILFKGLLKDGRIDEKKFGYCYLKIIDNIKNGSPILRNGFEILEQYLDKFDGELFERLLINDTCYSEYLKAVIKKDFNNVIVYLLNNHNKLSSYDLRSFLDHMSYDEIIGLVHQCNIRVDDNILDSLIGRTDKEFVPEEAIYNFWEKAGKPTGIYDLLKYKNICYEMLDIDLSAFDNSYSNYYGVYDIAHLFNVYNYFLEHNNLNVADSPLFYDNDCILMKLSGMEVGVPFTAIPRKEKQKLKFNLCKDNKELYSKLFGGYFSSGYVETLIEDEPLHVLEVLNYKTNVTSKIIKKLKEIGYIPTKETPECYFCDFEFVKVFLDNNPDEIMWMVDVLNRNDITLSDNTVNRMISDMIKEKGIYGEFKRVYYSDEYILESIKQDINFIDNLYGVSLSTNVLKEIFPLVLEKIKSGEYVVSDNTPIFILFNEEIRAVVRETNPEFANRCYLSRLDNALDMSLIEKAIQEPTNVDEIFEGIDRNYPEEEIDKLVEKLILINYQISDKTPHFLLCNTSFVYYALKHNMSIDKKYIENFTTFESYYKTLDKELFVKLINDGYGMQLQSFIRFIGVDRTLELASQYGYLLSVVPLQCVSNEDDLIYELLRNNYVDVFLRCNDTNKVYNIINNREYLFLSSYSNELMNIYSKDISRYKNHLIALFRSDISPYCLPSLCNNQELYDLYIDNAYKTDYLINAINMAKEENLTKSNVLKAIRKGYIISRDTPLVIKHSEEYVELIIKACRDEKVLKEMIDSNKDIVMNNETIMYLSSCSYKVSESTPDVLLNNVSFIVNYLNRVTVSSDYRKVINLINDESKISEIVRSVDLQKFILYFDVIDEDNKKSIIDKYFQNINGKRELLIKLIVDGKKMNPSIRKSFEDHFLNNIDTMNFDQMEKLKDCLYRIEHSNSGEIRQFASTLVSEVIKLPNYEDAFNKIERIFLTDSLPMTKKLFLVFKVLNKDYTRFINNYSGTLSPVLLSCNSDEERDSIIYGDLVRYAFASNNRSVREYLEDLDNACKLLEQYEKDNSSVGEDDLRRVILFLLQLVNSRYIQSNMDKEVKLTNDYEYLISLIKDTFNGYKNLKDAVVQNLFDISTFDEAIRLLDENAKKADRENRLRAMEPFVLEPGDFIKGIGQPTYLTNILQNGSVAREFLGEAAGSDATPLDTDLSKVLVVGDTLEESIGKTAAAGYGPIWFILKDGSHIVDTRKVGEEIHPELYDSSKLESFHTGVLDHTEAPHYGIRTGFAASQISYIVTDDKRVFLEVALNGFYIPVINKNGELIFTPDDYDKLRQKMSGLEYYGAGDYRIASKEDLLMPGVKEFADKIQDNRTTIKRKHNAIKEVVRKGMESVGIAMKDKLDGDLMTGCADLIDTGSTARGTDLPGKADFDYICRVDRNLFMDKKKFAKFREAIIAQFGDIEKKEFAGDNFRFKGVTIPGLEEKVDLDISFVVRTTKLSLSSDESLLRVMDGIEQGSFVEPDGCHDISSGSEARDLVSANILMAKKLFKAYSCYKNHRNKETPQGGLGGIGIENWVLQCGGSLKLAAEEFLSYVESSNSYDDFKHQYSVWDFGQNHYSFEDNKYSHDDFVYNNMDANGYARMVIALRNYLSMGEKAFDEDVIARIDEDVKAFKEEMKAKANSETVTM